MNIAKYKGMTVEVTLKVRAYIANVSDARGSCTLLVLDRCDHQHQREIWVDASEIVEAKL